MLLLLETLYVSIKVSKVCGLNIWCFHGIFAGVQKVLGVVVGIVFNQHIFQERDGLLAFKELAINFAHDELQVNLIGV